MTHRTVEQQAQTLADYMPGGRLFRAKNLQDSNFRRLLRGVAEEVFRADELIAIYKEDINPSVTQFFLDEWEQALGIPDSCFPGTGTDTERRRNILIKLASLGVQTADDFVDLAAMFGYTVRVEPGSIYAIFPAVFPFYFFASEQAARFTIFVWFTVPTSSRFTYTFPIPFGDSTTATLECLFRKLKPANCDIVFFGE